MGVKECLYVPRGWWHHVVSRGRRNVAVNFWGNSFGEILAHEHENLLRYLVCEVGERRCREKVENWEDLDEEVKERHRGS